MDEVTRPSDSLIYLYGIVPAGAPAPPADLLGVEEGPVWLLSAGEVAGVVSQLPRETYSDDALNSRLDDLAWVGERGLAHERVLDWYAERGPVIPLSLFSLHADEARLRSRLASEEEAYAAVLRRLEGRREWGVRLWRRDSEAAGGIDRLSASLQAIGREIEAAPAGRRFLLEKKRQTMRTEELRTTSKRLAHDLFAALRELADGATTMPIPQGAGGERTLLLHGAFLIHEERFPAFQRALGEQAAALAESGFEVEFTGPWPPYHFADLDDE
jgi:hypothetical protein